MTTAPLMTHQDEDGQTLKLCLSENQDQYLYYEGDTMKYQFERFQLPWNTDLPRLNAESLFLSLQKSKTGREGLDEAIQQIKEGKRWVAGRAIEVGQLNPDDPEGFKSGLNPLDYLFNQLVSPHYHLVLYQEEPQDCIDVMFILKGLISDWIPCEHWNRLYDALVIAANDNLPSHLTLGQWQWLSTLEVQHLFQFFIFSFERAETQDKALNNLNPISPENKQSLGLFKDVGMYTLFYHLLHGFPMDTALSAAMP